MQMRRWLTLLHAAPKLRQSDLASFFVKTTESAARRKEEHKKEVGKARKAKRAKKAKKRVVISEDTREEARWADSAECSDQIANREGKLISVVETSRGRKRKVTTSAYQ